MPLTPEEKHQPGPDLVTYIDQTFRGRMWKVRTCLSPTTDRPQAQGVVIEIGPVSYLVLGSMFEAFTLALILLQAVASSEAEFDQTRKEAASETV